jgi:tetratricopeptide (TPR) repeat protein
MGHLLRILAFAAVLAAGAPPLAAFDGPTQTKADSKKAAASGKAGEAKDAAAAEPDNKASDTANRMLETGIKAYQGGNMNQAIRAFDTALRGGGLASQQIARALYYRGLSYRKKGKPGLAISDLTSAAWLKDGLSASEKQEALSNRSAAYREAGIGDVPEVDQSPAGADWQTAMNGAKAPSADGSPPQATVSAAPPVYAAPPAHSAPPAPPASAPVQTSSGSSSGGVGGFFNSLFGGGSSSSGAASQDEVTTASIEGPAATNWQTTESAAASPPPQPQIAPQTAARAAPPPQAAPQAAPPPPRRAPPQAAAPLPWATPAAPQAASSGFVTQVAAAPPPRADTPAAAPAEPSGKYHVQVAAVRTRSEAYALAVRLVSQHGSELGGRKPLVDDTVIGSMGTFYRVRLGPYASAKEPQHLCGSLRSSGFDCLVVTQ